MCLVAYTWICAPLVALHTTKLKSSSYLFFSACNGSNSSCCNSPISKVIYFADFLRIYTDLLFISPHEKYVGVISGLLGCHAISRALRFFPFGNQNSGVVRTDAVVVVPTDGGVPPCWKQSTGSLFLLQIH